MTHITTADGRTVSLDALERAAREATPGPVKVAGANDDSRWLLPDCFPYECWITVAGRDCAANAAHIAAFDRDVCLALIAALRQADERAREERERVNMEWWQELVLVDNVAPNPAAAKDWLMRLSAHEQAEAVREERERAVGVALAERESLLAYSRTCDDRESRQSFVECSNTANAIANAICPDIAAAFRSGYRQKSNP